MSFFFSRDSCVYLGNGIFHPLAFFFFLLKLVFRRGLKLPKMSNLEGKKLWLSKVALVSALMRCQDRRAKGPRIKFVNLCRTVCDWIWQGCTSGGRTWGSRGLSALYSKIDVIIKLVCKRRQSVRQYVFLTGEWRLPSWNAYAMFVSCASVRHIDEHRA